MHQHVVIGEAERSTLPGSRDSRITKARIACVPKQEEPFQCVLPTNLRTRTAQPKFPCRRQRIEHAARSTSFRFPGSGIGARWVPARLGTTAANVRSAF